MNNMNTHIRVSTVNKSDRDHPPKLSTNISMCQFSLHATILKIFGVPHTKFWCLISFSQVGLEDLFMAHINVHVDDSKL